MDRCQDNQELSEVAEQLEKSLTIDTEDSIKQYNRLNSDGKNAAKEGDIKKALDLFKQAHKIYQTPKLERRIKKIEEVLTQTDLEDEDDEFVNVNGSGLMLYRELYDKLYNYQRDGVSFLYGLYRDGRKGGVLADDMGLGKTIQVISFLSGMYDNELAKHALLIMPTSLITNWTKEFSKWTPGMRVKEFHGSSRAVRTTNLEKVQRRGGVIITTYTMLMNNWQQLASYQGREFIWDYVILDEAHKIKNSSTKTAKSAYAIPSKNRVLLTGTPVQNNLKEMWTLFDFACQGSLLGTAKTFKSEYENPITRARERDATPGEKVLGSRMSENLMVLIKPYFLRRTKSEVQKKSKDEGADNKDEEVPREQSHSGAVMPKLTRKNDLIVWTYLSAVQEDIYRQFIGLDHIKELLMTTRSPLAELTILKKLCDHPRLLSANAIAKLGLEESPEDGFQSETTETDTNSIANISDETLISESGKLVFLLALLGRLREEGHRTLVFAHYRKVLDIIERILGNRGFKVLRLDGTITQIAERERLISLFQTDRRYSVFLLTTQVGGVGITLTAANRVVIYDPSWNPATDAQAVDRAYRIGQTENVVIYRLITCGTVEEKIYRRQVFKDSLIRQNTGDKKNPFRYFSRQDLKELFLLEDPHSSSTQLQLQALHSQHRQTDPGLDEHIAHLYAMHMFGISDHDLMFSLDVHHDEAPENQEEHQYIEGRVQKAQELMRAESELQKQITESVASNTEPAWLRNPPSTNSREKRPRNPKPSPSLPHADSSFSACPSPAVVDLDRSGSGGEDCRDHQSVEVIDLTTDVSPQQLSTSDGDPMDKSSGHDPSLLQTTPDRLDEGPNRTSQSELDLNHTSPLQNRTSQSELDLNHTSPLQNRTSQSELDLNHTSPLQNRTSQSELDLNHTSPLQNRTSQSELDLNHTSPLQNRTSQSEQDLNHTSPLQNRTSQSELDLNHTRTGSVLQQSNCSFRAQTSRVSVELESLNGNFNLELDDSVEVLMDPGAEEEEKKTQMDTEEDLETEEEEKKTQMDTEEDLETEEEEQKLLSQLQTTGTFDVLRSLSESQHRASVLDGSLGESIVTSKKRRAAVIYDSEEDEEEEQQPPKGPPLNDSFQVLGASTPKSALSPRRRRKSVGNLSVASQRSLLRSIVNNVDIQEEDKSGEEGGSDNSGLDFEEEEAVDKSTEDMENDEDDEKDLSSSTHEDEEESEEEEAVDKSTEDMENDDEDEDVSQSRSELKQKDPISSSREEESEEEEAVDKSTEDMENDEEDGDDDDDVSQSRSELKQKDPISSSREEKSSEEEKNMSFNREESSCEPELGSGETMDQCAAESSGEPETYDSLVLRGKECYSQTKLDEALSFFLRAIDMKPGDPEVQFLTIQLYRQLTQRQ